MSDDLVGRLRCVAVALRQDRPYAAQAALEAAELIERLSDQNPIKNAIKSPSNSH